MPPLRPRSYFHWFWSCRRSITHGADWPTYRGGIAHQGARQITVRCRWPCIGTTWLRPNRARAGLAKMARPFERRIIMAREVRRCNPCRRRGRTALLRLLGRPPGALPTGRHRRNRVDVFHRWPGAVGSHDRRWPRLLWLRRAGYAYCLEAATGKLVGSCMCRTPRTSGCWLAAK